MLFHDVQDIVGDMPITAVRPREFFIAFSGVPVLAYEGFSRSLLLTKCGLEQTIPNLRPENPGAKWPKTTLGCLKKEGTMSDGDAHVLRNVCAKVSGQIDKTQVFEIDKLSMVEFQCRSLERRSSSKVIPLVAEPRDIASPPRWHLNRVAQATIIGLKAAELDEYVKKGVLRLGNDEPHYRGDYCETTLVWDFPIAKQPSYIENFINEIEALLPGKYAWFMPESRHMTIRGLV